MNLVTEVSILHGRLPIGGGEGGSGNKSTHPGIKDGICLDVNFVSKKKKFVSVAIWIRQEGMTDFCCPLVTD